MKLKTPSFWYRAPKTMPSIQEILLLPFSALYALGRKLHKKPKTKQAPVPVVCIGNLVAGGSGKTPAALAIMRVIKEQNIAKNPFFLTRGYGGTQKKPLAVDPLKHSALKIGDEPLLLAQAEPTIVSPNRYKGALLADKMGADLVVMDDGLQNPALKKDIKIIVIDGQMGFGNRKMIPAGPLREPLKAGLKKADGFVIIGDDKHNIAKILPQKKPIFTAKVLAKREKMPPLDKKYIAFAGLGYPEKFFSFLKNDLALTVVKTISFPDHYSYNKKDLRKIHRLAKKKNAELITTEKDFVRLPKISDIHVHSLKIDLVWNTEDDLVELLKNRLN